MPIETHYSILGISRAASTDDIEAAYRAILLANHPDKIKYLDPFQRTLAEARLRAGKTAYEVLIDPNKAKKYDDEMEIWGSFGNAQTWRRPWEPRVTPIDASEPVPPRRPAGQGTTSDAEEHKCADAKEEETRPYAGGSTSFPTSSAKGTSDGVL
jgi:curved DNA-binding protein CbpA